MKDIDVWNEMVSDLMDKVENEYKERISFYSSAPNSREHILLGLSSEWGIKALEVFCDHCEEATADADHPRIKALNKLARTKDNLKIDMAYEAGDNYLKLMGIHE